MQPVRQDSGLIPAAISWTITLNHKGNIYPLAMLLANRTHRQREASFPLTVLPVSMRSHTLGPFLQEEHPERSQSLPKLCGGLMDPGLPVDDEA